MNKRRTKKEKMKRKLLFFSFVIILVFILGFCVGNIYPYNSQGNKDLAVEEIAVEELRINEEPLKINTYYPLENLLRELINKTKLVGGNCLDYALYYKGELEKVPQNLDVRKIDMAGVCPIGEEICGESEGIPHTYLIVNGLGGECILDQRNLVCIQLIK